MKGLCCLGTTRELVSLVSSASSKQSFQNAHANLISSVLLLLDHAKRRTQATHNWNLVFPPHASKNTPTLQSPTETGYPLASNSLPLATPGCTLPSTNNIKSSGACPIPLQGLGQEGMLARNGYHLRSAPPRCQLAQPPLPLHSFKWAAMRKLGFLAKPAGASLALGRLEKWGGVWAFFCWGKRRFSRTGLLKINWVSPALSTFGCFLLFYLFSNYHAVGASQTNTEVNVFSL